MKPGNKSWAGLLAALAWLAGSHLAPAQNVCCVVIPPTDTNITAISSGGEFALQMRTRQLQFEPLPGDYSISFEFGFATDEGEIFDSLSLVMQNTNTGVAAMLLTADVTGFNWAPPTPGLLPIPDSILTLAPAVFPEMRPLPRQRTAYQVTFCVRRNWRWLRRT